MDRREYIQMMREECTLKGKMPTFVYLKLNDGRIYNEGKADFIMSFRDDILYFQFVSSFLHKLKPRYDLSVNIKRFVAYKHVEHVVSRCLILYDKEGNYLPINYFFGTGDSFEDNMKRFIKELEEKYKIKQMVERNEKR